MEKALLFLRKVQEMDGSFINFSSSDPNNFSSPISYKTTFTTSLILLALYQLRGADYIQKTVRKAINFLYSQKSSNWSYNYFAQKTLEINKFAYPDDLDDTFVALSALFLYNPTLFTGNVMAKVVNLLVATEVQEGGPYRTWLVEKNTDKKWLDVDIAVNSNIAFFLFLQDIQLKKHTDFFDKHISEKDFSSPYYPSFYPIIYFLSRFYKGEKKEQLVQFVLDKKNNQGYWENPLYTALAVSSLINLGKPIKGCEKAFSYLRKTQKKDGSWDTFTFCIDPAINGKTYYAGSPALSTAFCLEAISKYTSILGKNPLALHSKQKTLYPKVYKNLSRIFSPYGLPLKKQFFKFVDNMILNDSEKNIPLLPYYFAKSLDEKNKVPEKLLVQLGSANVLGWVAYTIFDKFLDNEGKPFMLPLANCCLEETLIIFKDILPDTSFFPFAKKILRRLEEANLWEVKSCRFDPKRSKTMLLPDYRNLNQLAQKSFGHALGPLAIMFSLNFKENSKDVKYLIKFFQHYLIAKQLNDDAHDYEEDFKMGHMNAVTEYVLRKFIANSSSFTVNMSVKLLPKIQNHFWKKGLHEIAEIILDHTKKARQALTQCTVITHPDNLLALLIPQESSAKEALSEHKRTKEFLQNYK